MSTADQMVAQVIKLQDEIWQLAETAASQDGRPQVASLMLPALNEMFDLGATRYAAVKFHISLMILWFLFVFSMLASLSLNYRDMASSAWTRLTVFSSNCGRPCNDALIRPLTLPSALSI